MEPVPLLALLLVSCTATPHAAPAPTQPEPVPEGVIERIELCHAPAGELAEVLRDVTWADVGSKAHHYLMRHAWGIEFPESDRTWNREHAHELRHVPAGGVLEDRVPRRDRLADERADPHGAGP